MILFNLCINHFVNEFTDRGASILSLLAVVFSYGFATNLMFFPNNELFFLEMNKHEALKHKTI